VPTAALLKGRINREEEKRMKITILISIAMIRVGILYLLLLLTSVEFLPTDIQRKKNCLHILFEFPHLIAIVARVIYLPLTKSNNLVKKC
jgi:hypothetical protein